MVDNAGLVELLAIANIPGVGKNTSKTLIAYLGSAQHVLSASKGKLLTVPGVGEHLANSIIQHKTSSLEWAERQLEACVKNQVQVIHQQSAFYPKPLLQIETAPFLLFAKGNLNSLKNNRMIAVVGTRSATSYGKAITERIVSELSTVNTTIVSGLAFGIDIVAHRTSIMSNIPTIAVLGGGLQSIYPAQHKSTALELQKEGCLLSEYPWGIKPDPSYFPERNRIVAGMCDAVIVVEAAKKGGALITAEFANEYNREVYAVPGKIGETYSEGCLHLIKEHKAHIFTSVNDLIEDLNWNNPILKSKKTFAKEIPQLEVKEEKVYKLLQESGPLLIDDIAWKCQLSMNELASILLKLEFLGLVKPKPGKKFELT